jgi:hypothetical protein
MKYTNETLDECESEERICNINMKRKKGEFCRKARYL